MQKTYKPGEIAPSSGEYEIVGPRGGGTGKERTVVKDKPFPPTQTKGQTYRINRPAHNNAGKTVIPPFLTIVKSRA